MGNPPDLDETFYLAFVNACGRLRIDPHDLIRVCYSESGVKASAHNPHGHASGIFQAMPDTLVGLGWTKGHDAYRQLSAAEQVPYLERYFRPWAEHCKSDALCYTACFLPAMLKKAAEVGESYVLCGARGPLTWAYVANKGLDYDGDGNISLGDLGRHLERVCRGARYEVIVNNLREAMGLQPRPLPEPEPTVPELPNPISEDDGGAARRDATLDTVEHPFEEKE